MAISFNQIPNVLLTPGAYVEYDSSRAVQGLAPIPNRVLLVGSKTSAGSVAEEVLTRIRGENDGDGMFGARSQLAHMIRAFKKINRFTEVWAIAKVDDGAGVAHTKTVTFANNATSAGVWHFLIHGVRVSFSVASGDTPTEQGDALAAAVAAEPRLMYTAASAAGVVTLTASHAAAFTGDLDVRVNYYERESLDAPSATTVAIADGVAGAGNPDVADVIAAVGDEHFPYWVLGWDDATNVAAAETHLLDQWGPLIQQDAMVFAGTAGDHASMLAIGGARNSQFSSLMGAGLSPTPPWEYAAQVAGASAGEPDPARPRQRIRLPHVLPPAMEDRLTREDRQLLLDAGISTYLVDQAGQVYIERLVTTYQTNADGIEDRTFLDVCTMLTLAALRYTLRARITTKYPRHKLAGDNANYGPGQAIVTPSVIRGEILALFTEWELRGWVEDFEQFKEELIVERNADDPNRVDALLGPNLVNQFRVFAGQIQFIV